jgi:oligopeptidase B
MKNLRLPLVAILGLILFSCSQGPVIMPPVAEKIPHELFDKRNDNYFWMRLSDEQKNAGTPDEQTAKVLDYLNSGNDYAKAVLKHTDTLQKKIFNEIVGRIKQNDESVPYLSNGYWYFNKYSEGKEYPAYYRRKGTMDAPEELLVDVNKLAEGKNYCSVTGLSVSRDNRILAYGTDFVSRRRYTINFLDLTSGKLLPDIIENTTGHAIWAADNKTIFYTLKNIQTLRNDRVKKHILGTPAGSDKEVYYEVDETFDLDVSESKSRKYILINSDQTLTTETRFIESTKPDAEPRVFEPRMVNHEYQVDHLGNTFYIRTNCDSARNFKLMMVADKDHSRQKWTDMIPHRNDVLFEGFGIFNDYLVSEERIKGLNNLRVISFDKKSDYYIDFGEEVFTAGIGINRDPASKTLRFSYSSLTTPNSVIDLNMATKEKKVMKQEEVLGGFDRANYESRRLWARAGDGTMIPVSLVYRKGFVQDGKSPLLLYAYGSYGSSTNPSFMSDVISLLDRGFVYAIAHIRGGSEMGRYWYEDGKLLKKINTFTDFNDCASFLIGEKYTNSSVLFAQGGSAGGLLMGAILNMKPELYKGVIAEVPFVDVVTTMLDASIPLTTFEWDEWGNPAKKEYYDYMLSYSPYDQVKAQAYPNIIVTTGYWDSQVQYWEPAKWVAKLRDMKTDRNLLVMDCNMSAGHGGASGRFERYRITSLQYAFITDLAGIKK